MSLRRTSRSLQAHAYEAAAGEIRHGDLDDMGEIRMDSYGSVYLNPVDSGDDLGDNSCSDSEESDVGFVDEEYDMADDDTLFDRNVDEDVDESDPLSHTDLFSNAIHEQLRDSDGDADLTLAKVQFRVWRKILMYLNMFHLPSCWQNELDFVVGNGKGKSFKAQLCRSAFCSVVYNVWLERSRRVFKKEKKIVDELVFHIINSIRKKVSSWKDLVM
ncbi:hypothetical protein LIER_05308 [Lithospermum erythrorhizon]|uniref:Uncharacterized protein n=1 Tax=Lithospermum erythrorhizon TaxID=34254 RepID=A0AAV3P1A1_LITER